MTDARLPPPVKPGARVGVAALSGPVEPERLEAGLDALAELGFDPICASNLRQRDGLFAGHDDARLAGLDEILADDSVEAIFFARGGHGSLRLLPRLNWDRITRRPRAWIGYSDLTPLLNLLVERLGWVAFHGPMVAVELASGLDEAEQSALLAALAGDLPLLYEGIPLTSETVGDASGPLRGGCLSMICTLLGTPFALSLRGSILALEDVGEPLYRLDRMLTHLALSGSLIGVRGVVLGGLQGNDEAPNELSTIPGRVRSLAPDVPILHGLQFGHVRPQMTLPLGLPARIDLASRHLILEQPKEQR